jgi:hypothetical protein
VLLCLLLALLEPAMLPAQQSGQPQAKPEAPSGASAPIRATAAHAAEPNGSEPRKSVAPRWTRYCLELGGFCFEHPAGWSDLGAVYNGAGVVFAEPDKQRPQAEWNHITAVALDLPQSSQQADSEGPAAGSERPSMNELINRAMMPPEGATIHTLERMENMVGGYPAQVITAEVREQGKPVAIEQVAFIDADDVLYSVALRCAPADFRRLKPVFLQALKSWSEMPESPPEPGAPKSGNEQK